MRKLVILLTIILGSPLVYGYDQFNDPLKTIEHQQRLILDQMQWQETLQGREQHRQWLEDIRNQTKNNTWY